MKHDLAVWRMEQEIDSSEARGDVGMICGFTMVLTDIKVSALVLCIIMSQAMNSALNDLLTIVSKHSSSLSSFED